MVCSYLHTFYVIRSEMDGEMNGRMETSGSQDHGSTVRARMRHVQRRSVTLGFDPPQVFCVCLWLKLTQSTDSIYFHRSHDACSFPISRSGRLQDSTWRKLQSSTTCEIMSFIIAKGRQGLWGLWRRKPAEIYLASLGC